MNYCLLSCISWKDIKEKVMRKKSLLLTSALLLIIGLWDAGSLRAVSDTGPDTMELKKSQRQKICSFSS